MKYISWNVNSVRSRLPILLNLIKKESPDVLMLQELKCVEEAFPFDAFPNYKCYVYGQKSYNGVAILLKQTSMSIDPGNQIMSIDSVEKIVLGGRDEARCIKILSGSKCLICIYVPCGEMSLDKYEYKKTFLRETAELIQSIDSEQLIIGGDFNVAITDQDVQYPMDFKDSALCRDDVRQLMKNILKIDLNDTIDMPQFSWWDYRQPNKGVRIDYILTRGIEGKQRIRKEYRRTILKEFIVESGELKVVKPSDHAPIVFLN